MSGAVTVGVGVALAIHVAVRLGRQTCVRFAQGVTALIVSGAVTVGVGVALAIHVAVRLGRQTGVRVAAADLEGHCVRVRLVSMTLQEKTVLPQSAPSVRHRSVMPPLAKTSI